jgi:hypothetical protein
MRGPFCLSLCLAVLLSVICACDQVRGPSVCLFCLSVFRCVCLSVGLSVCRSIIYLSVAALVTCASRQQRAGHIPTRDGPLRLSPFATDTAGLPNCGFDGVCVCVCVLVSKS